MATLGRTLSRTCGAAARTFSSSGAALANKPGAGASEGSTSQPPTGGDAPRPADQRTPGRFQDSSAALSYKLSHHRSRPPALPTIDPPRWSAEQAVTNILSVEVESSALTLQVQHASALDAALHPPCAQLSRAERARCAVARVRHLGGARLQVRRGLSII